MAANDWKSLFGPIDVTTGGLQAVGDAGSPTTGNPPLPQPPEKKLPEPTMASMAASFASSMAQFAASGFRTVSSADHDRRLATCQACEHLGGDTCQLCGCFVDKKAWMPHEDCPIGKWPPKSE